MLFTFIDKNALDIAFEVTICFWWSKFRV